MMNHFLLHFLYERGLPLGGQVFNQMQVVQNGVSLFTPRPTSSFLLKRLTLTRSESGLSTHAELNGCCCHRCPTGERERRETSG
jgi:hypothetical protein